MNRRRWDSEELIIAFSLYCQMPFGKIHQRNPVIVDVSRQINRTPSALAMKMLNFASLDPEIIKSGRSGLGNASAKDEEIWNEFHNDWDRAVEKAQELLGDTLVEPAEPEDYSSEDVKMEIKVRRKQHFFRKAILSGYKEACYISGLNHPRFLIASHIKPWSLDQKNRLNPRNGLCLSVLYDRAFDLGLITVTTDYKVEVSDRLREEATDPFSKDNLHSIHGKKITLPEKFLPSRAFLSFHNHNIFQN